MDLLQVMTGLYSSEINFGMQSLWDTGFEVWLGDSLNGCRSVQSFGIGEMETAARWLDGKAREIYPNSDYARGRPKQGRG